MVVSRSKPEFLAGDFLNDLDGQKRKMDHLGIKGEPSKERPGSPQLSPKQKKKSKPALMNRVSHNMPFAPKSSKLLVPATSVIHHPNARDEESEAFDRHIEEHQRPKSRSSYVRKRTRGASLYSRRNTYVKPTDLHIYLGGENVKPIDSERPDQLGFSQNTFMHHWKTWFSFLQILYLTVVLITLLVININLIVKKWKLEIEDLHEEYPDEEFSETKLFRQKVALIVILFLAIPAHLIVYQGRLLTLTAFKWIKMNA